MNEQAPQKEDPWHINLLWSVGCFILAYISYGTLTDVENGNAHRVNSILAFVYGVAGKWPAVGLVVAMGIFFLVLAVKGYLKTKKS